MSAHLWIRAEAMTGMPLDSLKRWERGDSMVKRLDPVNVVVKLLDSMNDRESLAFQLRVATLS